MNVLADSSGSHLVKESGLSDGSLDPERLLDGPGEKWIVSLYPEAGEATITRLGGGPAPDRAAPPLDDPDRRELLDLQHARAAKARIRRYVRANRLAFLWTCTFAEAVRSLTAAGKAWDAFVRRMREAGICMPWVAVFEPHPGGHGYHVHFACDRFVSIELIRKLWSLGHVFVSESFKTNKKGNSPRKVAKYLAKYVSKTLDAPSGSDNDSDELAAEELAGQVAGRRRGEHRYRVAQGFAPQKVTRHFRTPERAYEWLRFFYGEEIDGRALCFITPDRIDGWWLDYADRVQWPPPMTRGAEAA